MRRRLIAAMVGLVVVTMALYVVPRTFFTVDFARSQQVEQLERSARLIGRGIEILVDSGVDYGPESFPKLLQPGEELTVEREDQAPVVLGSVADARSTQSVTQQVGEMTITLRVSSADIEDEVSAALRPVPYLVALAGAAGILLALYLAGRLVRPFVALAEYTEEFDPAAETIDPPPRSNLPEANALGDVLERRGEQVRTLIRRERQFSANASHQLRTPLAALRLRLEDLQMWPDVSDEVRAELDEIVREADRLSGTIQDLLTLARSGGLGSWDEVDVNAVASSAADRWRDLLSSDGRRIDVEVADDPALVASSARSLGEILNVVLENAYSHGRGTVRMQVRQHDDHVSIVVADEGTFASQVQDRSSSQRRASGEGIGLGLANVIAEAVGARLVLVDREPTTFELRLPRRDTSRTVSDPIRDAGGEHGPVVI